MPILSRNIALFTCITMLVLIVFLQAFMVLYFKQNLKEVKWKMKIQMLQHADAATQQVFYFTNEEWLALPHPDPHEFILNGEYYDVYHKELVNQKWEVHCVHDAKEGKIKQELKKWMADEHSPYQKKKAKGNVFSITKKIFLEKKIMPFSSLVNEKKMGENNCFGEPREPYLEECFDPPCSTVL